LWQSRKTKRRSQKSQGFLKSRVAFLTLAFSIDGLSRWIHSKFMSELVAYTNGDVKESIDRAKEAKARQWEQLVRRFNGDKVAAQQYMNRTLRGRKQLNV
jgi:hypothetical protein